MEVNHKKRVWFEAESALYIIRDNLKLGKRLIRIATGFFSVRGYNLIRPGTHGKKMYILVGLDKPSLERARKALVQEIMDDLRRGSDLERRQAVIDLIEKMEGGNFRIIDMRAKDIHAKVFIVDETIAISASSNVSERGMLRSIENGAVVTNLEDVLYLVEKYDEHFFAPDALDITQDLIDELKRWLGMASPWDIYLRTLVALKDLEEPQIDRNTFKKPVGYQQAVIARLVRQITDFSGAMLLASTGLGKTVIAANVAWHLRRQGEIDNLLVIGPKPVEASWRSHLRPTGIHTEYFNFSALYTQETDPNTYGGILQEILDFDLDARWMIVIDESHQLRNRFDVDWDHQQRKLTHTEKTAFKKLVPAIEKSQCKVLVQTATPYAKDIKNLNNQLFLLPHQKPEPNALFPEMVEGSHAWRVNEVKDLEKLEVVSKITTPDVARSYSKKDESGIYIEFNKERKYIPKVNLFAVSYILPVETEMTQALSYRAFGINNKRSKRQPIETTARVAWGSSPWALQEVADKAMRSEDERGYKVNYFLDEGIRFNLLQAVSDQIKNLSSENDPKLKLLLDIIRAVRAEQNRKIIIFSERHATLGYLETELTRHFPQLRIGSTVSFKNIFEHGLKPEKEVKKIVSRFAPIANQLDIPQKDQLDILLATDAHGVGINLQDADTVINYDLAWVPIEPTQRAGRILRLWHEPRHINLFAFIPKIMEGLQYHEVALVAQRFHTLMKRHQDSQQVTEMPSLTHKEEETFHLGEIAKIKDIQFAGDFSFEAIGQMEEGKSSPIFEHTANLERYKEYARKISDDIISARTFEGSTWLVYVLLQYRGRYHWAIYDASRKQLERKYSDIQLLNLIRCEKDMPLAPVSADKVESLSDECILAWCRHYNAVLDDVFRICAMILIPREQEKFLQNMFS